MKRVFDHIRDRLLQPVSGTQEPPMPSLDSLEETETHREVWKMCDNRMILGAFRYGLFESREREYAENGQTAYDHVAEAHRRISLYEADGNREWILDAINVLAMEFRLPSHPHAHFEAGDDVTHAKKRAA